MCVFVCVYVNEWMHLLTSAINKKAQLTMTNPHDAKACRKFLQFHVFTTLSLTILAYLHSLRPKSAKSQEIHWKFKLKSSRSSKVIDLAVNGKPICHFLLVINCNFSRICYRFSRYSGLKIEKCWFYPPLPSLTPPLGGTPLNFWMKPGKN